MWTERHPRVLVLLHLVFLHTCMWITCTRAFEFHLKEVSLSVKPENTVERGTKLTLTCVAKIIYTGSELPVLQFSFFKEFDNHNTIHITQTNSTSQASFSINHTRASDTGTYQCDVKMGNQYMGSSPMMINVKGLQTPVVNVDKLNMTEGDAVRVTCSAKDESSELTFSIKNNGAEIYRRRTRDGEVQKVLALSAGTTRLSCEYFINIGSTMLLSNSSKVVSVVVRELEFTPTIRVLPASEVIEGDSVRITCGVEGKYSNPPLLILYKESRLLQTRNKSEYETVVTSDNSGKYECSASVNKVEKNVYANLTVKELFSTPVLTITPAEVFERQQFTVTCRSVKFASERIGRHNVTYSLYCNKQLLNSTNGTYTTWARTQTNGVYTCTAQGKGITKSSRPISFTAKVLVSRPNISVLSEVVLDRPFQIECFSDRGSSPITYTLKQNQRTLSHITVPSQSQKAIFNGSIFSEKQITEFRCEAQNNGVESALLSDPLHAPVTVPVGTPSLLVLPVAEDVTEGEEVKFVCSVSHGTLPISFKWYQDENRRPVHVTTVTNNYSTYSLPSPSGVHSGRYYCEALNSAGNVKRSDYVLITVRMARWKKVLISTACVLCVLGLVLVLAFLMHYRAKRGKREIVVELSVKSAIPKYSDDTVISYPPP